MQAGVQLRLSNNLLAQRLTAGRAAGARRAAQAAASLDGQANKQQLFIGAVGAVGVAAVGLLALAVRQRQQQQQQQGGSRQQEQQQTSSSTKQQAGSHQQRAQGGSWPGLHLPLPLMSGSWPFRDREHELQQQLDQIHQQRVAEAARQLSLWDKRWALRSRPLPELRSLAAQHSIRGRSRMRRQELVAALEASLGYAQDSSSSSDREEQPWTE